MGRSCVIGGVHLVVCEPHRLIYRPLQKCASTTVINFIGDLAGYGDRRGGRDFLPVVTAEATPGRGGTYAVKVRSEAIPGFVERYAGYLWFSVIREPYGRLKSNYFNKLNRYAKRFEPLVYLRAYLRLAATGRAFWRPGYEPDRAATLRGDISFSRLLAGLREHGIAWDWHFAAQTDLLRTDVIPYHRLVRMERLADGLRAVADDAGAATAAAPALEALRQLNRSSADSAADSAFWNDEDRRATAELYRRDFQTLGYAA